MSKKKDLIADDIQQESLDLVLDQIIDGRMTIRVNEKVVIFREATDAEKFEADIFAQNHIEDLKARKEIKLVPSALVPMLVKKECEKYGIEYRLVNKRPEIMQKLFTYLQDHADDIRGKDINNTMEIFKYYNDARKASLTDEEQDLLSSIETIEQMVTEQKMKTYEHYGDKARTNYLLATVSVISENGKEVPAFILSEQVTKFGVLPIVTSAVSEWSLDMQAWQDIYTKYNSFEKGMGPNFLSQLSGLVNVGDSSGQVAKSSEQSPLEDGQQSGPAPN